MQIVNTEEMELIFPMLRVLKKPYKLLVLLLIKLALIAGDGKEIKQI
jgi:hypothetical protein